MNFMRAILYLLLIIVLSSCSFNDFDDSADPQIPVPTPNMGIATLRSMYHGDAMLVDMDMPVVLSGEVTTSDKANNFFRTFIIEDGSGSVEIKVGLYDLHTIYRLGQSVVVVANGLTMGMDNGILQLGLNGGSTGYQTDYMQHRYIADHYVVRGDVNRPMSGRKIPLSQINDNLMGRLVTIDNLKLDLSPSLSVDTTWAISQQLSSTGIPKSVSLKFRSISNDSIYLVTSGYASFAAQKVPSRSLSVTGILSKGNIGSRSFYQLKIRDLDDVKEY